MGRGSIFGFIGGGFATAIVVTLWPGGSYDECVVREMRGQDRSVSVNVERLCARKHGKEVRIFLPGNVDVEWSHYGGAVRIAADDQGSEYNLTRGEFRFSSKECEDSASEDFSEEVNQAFDSDGWIVFPMTIKPSCMRTDTLWGKFK